MIKSLNKRQLTTLLVILILLIAIPAILLLLRQQQIFRSHAAIDSRLLFVNANHDPLQDPVTTTSRNISLRIDHTGTNPVPPPPAGNNNPPPPVSPNPPPPSGSTNGASTGDCNFTGPNQLTVGQNGSYVLSSRATCDSSLGCSSYWQVYKPDATTGSSVAISTQDANSYGPTTYTFTPIASGNYQVTYRYNQLAHTFFCSENLNVTGSSSTNSCTACIADLISNGTVEGSTGGSDLVAGQKCLQEFGGGYQANSNGDYVNFSFDIPNRLYVNDNNKDSEIALCQKLDINHDRMIENDEVQCIANQNGNHCS